MARVDVGGDVGDAAVDDLALAFVEGAQRPLEVGLVGNDVRGTRGLHAADREDALLVVEGQQARRALGRRGDGVLELAAQGAVAPLAV